MELQLAGDRQLRRERHEQRQTTEEGEEDQLARAHRRRSLASLPGLAIVTRATTLAPIGTGVPGGARTYTVSANSASWSPPGSTTSPVFRIFTRAMMPRIITR